MWTPDETVMIESGRITNLRRLRIALDEYIKIKNEIDPHRNMNTKWMFIAAHILGQIRGESYAMKEVERELEKEFSFEENDDVDVFSMFAFMEGE